MASAERGEAKRKRMEESPLESLLCTDGLKETLLFHVRREGGISALNALAKCSRHFRRAAAPERFRKACVHPLNNCSVPEDVRNYVESGVSVGNSKIDSHSLVLPRRMTSLQLKNMKLKSSGAEALAQNLPSPLQYLNFDGNGIASSVAEMLAQHIPPSLQHPRLAGNKIGSSGAQALGSSTTHLKY